MDSLPNEILLNTFSYLSQVYVITICSTVCREWSLVIFHPAFYNTLHIYSPQYFKNIIQLTKEKKSLLYNNNPIGYYVKRLLFHYQYLPTKRDVKNIPIVFPNLQHISGLIKTPASLYRYNPIYLRLHQPIDFCYFYTNEQWIKKFNQVKYHLKSIDIYVTKKLIDLTSNQQQSLESIYLKDIESKNKNGKNQLKQNISIKILIFPTTLPLTNLITLNIDFTNYIKTHSPRIPYYIINEHTFENIHQYCPLLESLLVNAFYMSISDEYNNRNQIIPAHHLKSINITESHFNHPLCFHYLIIKYPHLESFSLNNLSFKNSSSLEEKRNYQNAMLNIFYQLHLLRQFSYNSNDDVWPRYEFCKWLIRHPNKLTQLKYTSPLTLIEAKLDDDLNNLNIHTTANNNSELEEYMHYVIHNNSPINNVDTTSLPPPSQQFQFLSHLTSLSLYLNDLIDLALVFFFFEHENTTIISTILKELYIEKNEKGSYFQSIYIYDWLDIFPNLIVFKIRHIGEILDNSTFYSDLNVHSSFEKPLDSFKELHQLLIKRKKKLQQQPENDNLNKKVNDHHRHQHQLYNGYQSVYKLKHLYIENCYLWFKDGFDECLKKCDHLKELELINITLINTKGPFDGIQLDLSHLHLTLLKLSDICHIHFNSVDKVETIGNIVIHETSSLRERTIIQLPTSLNNELRLYIKCKCIDEFINYP